MSDRRVLQFPRWHMSRTRVLRPGIHVLLLRSKKVLLSNIRFMAWITASIGLQLRTLMGSLYQIGNATCAHIDAAACQTSSY